MKMKTDGLKFWSFGLRMVMEKNGILQFDDTIARKLMDDLWECGIRPTSDIFIYCRGYDKPKYKSFSMFEYRKNEEYGKGFRYLTSGKEIYYKWARPEESQLFEKVPKDIMFSFRHGTSDFRIEVDKFNKDMTVLEIVRASDFKYVKQEEVDAAVIIGNIKNLSDIKKHWQLMDKYGFSPFVIEECLKAIGIKIPPVINGEIGIHTMMLHRSFSAAFKKIESKLKIEL